MKRLLLVLLVLVVAVAAARRVYGYSSRQVHGTPDHWPAVPRRG